MKKVIVLAVVATMLAVPAFAGILNSKHDLSTTGGSANSVFSNNTDEICVFCHTPHGGDTTQDAPLWNRSLGGVTVILEDLYNSATLQMGISNPTTVLNAVKDSDAALCLSCHDGTSLAQGLINPPSSNGNADPTFTTADRDAAGGFADLGTAGTMLVNDHPIGMTYTSALTNADGELNAPDSADYVDAAEDLKLYSGTGVNGTYTSVMWCSTCHDVHNPDKGTPFLNMTNDASALCLTCHDK